jgi:hypothetical protein
MDQLEILIRDVGGLRAAARICGKHESTVRRWRRGVTPMPAACYRALFAASSWGRSDRLVMTANEKAALYTQIGAQARHIERLEGQLAYLMRLGGFQSANDPLVAFG